MPLHQQPSENFCTVEDAWQPVDEMRYMDIISFKNQAQCHAYYGVQLHDGFALFSEAAQQYCGARWAW